MREGRSTSDAGVNPYQPHPFRVVGRQRETTDTVTLRIQPSSGSGLAAEPGQFMMLYVFGVGEVPISLSAPPRRGGVLEHTVRAVGPVTSQLTRLGRGDWVGVRGPYGRGWPLALAEGQDLVLIAGGLGLAPLRSALRAILARRDRYRRVTLLYGARTPADLLYRRDLSRWRRQPALELRVTVDRADEGWRGHVGVVTALLAQVEHHFAPKETVAMVCGPDVMMRFTVRELQRRGVPNDRIYLSLERNMKCALGLCGHCQFGPLFVCKDGPVLPYHRLAPFSEIREL
jgi:NAD(P)H-flavin reductase